MTKQPVCVYGSAMSASLRLKVMTLEDFLAWESRQEIKYEFDGFEPLAMPGGSLNHARIQRNLAISIGGRLQGGPCEFLGSDMKLVSATRSRYPDGQVVCGPQEGDARFVTTPVILFEVVSPDDPSRDRITKAAEYQRFPTSKRYVILEPEIMEATVMERRGETWYSFEVKRGDFLEMPEVGIRVLLDELYAGVRPAD